MAKIVTLTTDFGSKDPYVAEMKAVILGICREAIIVDVSHEVEKFCVQDGAYLLAVATPYFPRGTIHVAVVDPGVGTKRRELLVQTMESFFLGPDNGVLALAAEKQGLVSIHEIANPKLIKSRVSNTFHGRDVFAPAAAHLANGAFPSDFGREIHDYIKPSFVGGTFSKGTLRGEILHIDGFGNLITNLDETKLKQLRTLQGPINVKIANCSMKLKLGKAYGEIKPGEALVLLGSQGYVEIAVNQGNAAEKFKASLGDEVILS